MADNDGATYRQIIESDRFHYGAEIVSTRDLPRDDNGGNLAAFARALLADARIGWISITDNPGGIPMLPPDWLGGLLAQRRQNIVLHMTCKDSNRNGLEAAAWRYAAEGFENILAITGDYPTTGFGGKAEGVFDLDSTSLIALLRSMNDGLQVKSRRGDLETLPKTNFYIGCVVSPFKRYERELMPQYFKLVRKIAAGAHWVIPQLGYDMRKFHEIKLMLASRGIQTPVLGNVYLLTKRIARLFHDGHLAGCVVSDKLMDEVERYSAGPDKGRKFFIEFAAKQLAAFKGMGFAAGYIGGISKPETFGEVIDLAESFGADDWRGFAKEIQYPQEGEFYLFEQDPKTGLGEPNRINGEYLKTLHNPPKSKEVTLDYRFSRLFHRWFFARGKGCYGLMQRIFGRWDKKPGLLGRLSYAVEKGSKRLIYGCHECGDCSLPDCAYLCPKQSCSKASRNGPCGGSASGRCELDDKECFWARVYERLKSYGESERMLDRPITIYNAELKQTSSWANTYLDRDHNAEKKAPPSPLPPGKG
jgi:methylenetetrahydrofolate reductase (NADPH)